VLVGDRSGARVAPGLIGVALALLAVAAGAPAHEVGGPFQPDFVPPAPGTYVLQRIMRAPDGTVVDSRGRVTSLADVLAGKITVLGFIYTTCTDAAGCPFAYGVLVDLRARLDRVPALRDAVRLVSLSFDPVNDTPAVMKRYGGIHAGPRWAFLTTRSVAEVRPLLDGFGQDVRFVQDERGGSGALGHVLKVFLIDRRGMVREIYSTSFLVPQVMLNDVKTLLLEEGSRVD
jgi:cytochrome oxidase Cu insertion factor (SCO1/SenC/PrrC family)